MSLSLSLYLYLSLSIFFGHVMSSHHSEQMSQRSQVSRIALRRCSQNVFVFVIVFVIFFLVMSCLFITLNKCLKGHKSLGSLIEGVPQPVYLRGGSYRGNQKSSQRKKQCHQESHSSRDNLVGKNIFSFCILCYLRSYQE